MCKLWVALCFVIAFLGCSDRGKKTVTKDSLGEQFKTWHSRGGKSMRAKLIDISDNGSSIKVQKISGKTSVIPITHFSRADRDFLVECYPLFTKYEPSSPRYDKALERICPPVEEFVEDESFAEEEPEPDQSNGPSVSAIYRKMDEAGRLLRQAENRMFAACRKFRSASRPADKDAANSDFNRAVSNYLAELNKLCLPDPERDDMKRSKYHFYKVWVKQYSARMGRVEEKANRYYNMSCGLILYLENEK